MLTSSMTFAATTNAIVYCGAHPVFVDSDPTGERRPLLIELDLEYVDHHTLRADLKILLATVDKVMRRDGIAAEESATMPEFMGPVSRDRSPAGPRGDRVPPWHGVL